jgi:hypothetical protein
MNQGMNQPLNQPMNQGMNQPLNQPMNQGMNVMHMYLLSILSFNIDYYCITYGSTVG